MIKADSADYRMVFVTRVHQLLALGCGRIDLKRFHSHEEPEITGELVRAMDSVIDDTGSPHWVRKFSVHDDPPVNVPGRLGKSRRRIDIKVVSSLQLPRSCFSFEAKRLSKQNPVGDYIGSDGLGCFLDGHYAANDRDAGMLGYVQSDSPDEWATRLADRITRDARRLGLPTGGNWRKHSFRAGPSHTYHTRHSRKCNSQELDMYHTLLLCR
jgi:hypothetical protein